MDWDDEQVVYYVQTDEGEIQLDDKAKVNPRPHVLYQVDGDDKPSFHPFGFTCCNRFLYSFPVIMDGVSNRERIQKQSTVSSRLLILPFNCFLVKE